MADNLKYNEPGSGPIVATDEVASGHYQWFKLDVGPPNETIPVTGSTFGVPVDVKRVIGTLPISGNVGLNAGSNEVGIVKVSSISGVVSITNSSIATLTENAVFTGSADDVANFSEIQIGIAASHASATQGLSGQFSTDATNWDITELSTISGSAVILLRPKLRFFRLLYKNGATAQTFFRLQTVYKVFTTVCSDTFSAPRRTVISAVTGATTLLVEEIGRKGATFWNDSTSKLFIALGSNASSTNFTVRLNPQEYYELPFGYTGVISGVWLEAVGSVYITELT